MNKVIPALEEISQEIHDNLVKQFGIAPEKIKPEANLNKDLGLDSIDLVDLLSIASERFQTDLSPYDFEGVKTIQEFTIRLQQIINK